MRTSMDVLMKSIREAQRQLREHPAEPKEALGQTGERSLEIEDNAVASTAPLSLPVVDEHLEPCEPKLLDAVGETGDLLQVVIHDPETPDKDVPEIQTLIKLLEEKKVLIKTTGEAIKPVIQLDQSAVNQMPNHPGLLQDDAASQTKYCQSLDELFRSLSQLEVIGGLLAEAYR